MMNASDFDTVMIEHKEIAVAVNEFQMEQMNQAEALIGKYWDDPVKLAVCKRMLEAMVDVHREWIGRINVRLKALES